MKNLNLIERLWTDSHEKQKVQRFVRYAAMLIMLLTLGVGQMWGDGAIGYKGVKFTKNGSATGWYNIHQPSSWDYVASGYECRSGKSGVTDFNNANLGIVATLKLKAFVVIGWCNGNDYVAGQLKYRLYKQSASAGSYSTYSVGNYGNNSGGAANVLVSSSNDRVVGNASLTTDIVTSSTAPGNYYLQLQGLGRMQWKDGGNSGDFNAKNGSEVKATLTVPGFTTTSTSNAFGSVNVGSNSSTTISFTQHYGTTLTTSNCSLTNSTDFQVTGISETGVTVKFKPQATGDKSSTLTITDANSKTCTITLTGTGTAASTYTLTYHANYAASGTGNVPSSVDVPIDETTTVAGNTGSLAMDKYTFAGWNTSPYIDGTHYDAGEDIEMTDDIDLYATWTYNVTLNQNGATTSGSTSFVGTWNCSTIPAITNPSRTGYNFVYWNTEAGGRGSDVINPSGVLQASKYNWTDGSGRFQRNPGSQNKPLYAKWTENMSTVSLVASPTGKGSFTIGGDAATSTTAGVTTTRSVTAVPISGYHFVSWAITGGATISSTSTNPTTVTGGGAGTSATLTATFAADAENYTITYGVGTDYTSYGSVSEGHSYPSGSSQASGTEISLSASPATHYKLEGWYTTAACATPVVGAGTNNPYEFTLGANTSVYAKFILKQCTITLNKNGGSTGAASVTASHGSTLPSFTAHSRTGYTLNGYYTESSGGTKIINADGSLVASTTYANASKQWNNDATSLTLYAQWTAKQTTVTLNQQSGSGGTTGVTATYDAAMPAATMPTRTGYDFGGYYTETAGSGTQYYTSGGASARNWNITDATKTLYAKWTLHNYTITYNLDGGTNSPSNPATYTITDALITLQNPTKRGYNFDGWYTNSTKTTPGNTIAAGSHENKTFWAKWTAKENVTVKFKNTDNWDHVYAYAWDGETKLNGNWPGGEIYESDGWYTYSLKWGANIIFNNGSGTQSQNLTEIEEDICYIWDHGAAGPDSDCDGVPEYDTRTIFVHVANDWSESTLDIYTWGDNSGTYNSKSYPGSTHEKGGSMTEPIGGRWFKVTINNACANFKLSCNSNAKQTNDLTLSNYDDGTCWNATNGAVLSTTSCPSVPSVTNGSGASSVQDVQATLNGTSSSSPLTITEYGFYYSSSETTKAGLIENGTKVTGTGSASSFSYTATGLSTGTTYYYIAYAVNGKGIAYASSPSSFTTKFQLNYAIGDVKGGDGDITSDPPTSSGSYVLSGTEITLTAPDEKTGYTWKGWYGAANGSGDQLCSTQEYALTITANTTVYACYTENKYTVAFNNGDHGTVSPSGNQQVGVTGVSITATPAAGWKFANWSKTGAGVSLSSTTTNPTTVTASSTGSVTPNYAHRYILRGSIVANDATTAGMAGWSATSNSSYASATIVGNVMTITANLTMVGTQYKFKIYDLVNSSYKGQTGTGDIPNNKAWTLNGSNDVKLTTTVIGTYTFTYNVSTNSLIVTYPPVYTVTFGKGTGGNTISASATSAGGSFSSGAYVLSGDDITFTQSAAAGYTFKGWYDAASGGSEISCMSDEDDNVYDNIAGNISVYAQYTPKTYAVTFDATTNGGALSGSSPKNVIFDEASIASCPTATKNGYCLDGWYSAASDGVKVIDKDGNLQPNVSVSAKTWTDGTGKWKKDGTATVYAVFVAPDIELTKSGKGLISSMPGYDTLIINQSFGCTPTADYNISYTVGYAVSHTQLAPQPTIKYCDAAVEGVRHDTIIMPVGDGANSYEVVAYLKTGTTCGSGDLVTTDTIRADVESSYSVRVRAQVDGIDIAEERVALLYPSFAAIHVTIWKEINGYQLDHIDLGVGVTQESVSEEDTYYWNAYYAANASTITAVYKPKTNTVYFFDPDDNRSMYAATRTKLYDYGTGGYWHTDGAKQKGAGSYNMTGDTVVATGMGSSVWMASIKSGTTSFAFTSDKHNNVEEFYSYTASNSSKLPAHVIYRTDYNAATPMFVPVAKDKDDCYIINKNGDDGWAQYYRGFWIKRSPDPDSTGYYLKVYNKQKRSDSPDANTKDPELIQSVPLRLTQTGENNTWELTATIDLEANKTYGFKFTKATGASTVAWYADTNEGIMTSSAHTGWDNFVTSDKKNTGLTTTAAGDYTFHIYCVDYGTKAANAANATDVQGKFAVTVDYAAQSGDYRVIYSDATQTEVIASPSIRPRANGQDTVSFFIRKSDASRVMKIQQFTSSWGDVSTVDLSTIAKDSVYVIYLEQNEAGTSISTTGIDFYDGDYYIRTDCVDKYKWDYKKSLENHRMIPTDYGMTAKQPNKFSHYYVHWLTANSNVKFIVANKYAPCLSDTVITDDWVTDTGGKLGAKGANIRFMYNKGTNEAMRAYLYGSQENDPDYLKLSESTTSGYMKNRSGSTIPNITFSDLGNFTYQALIQAHPGLRGKLTAKYLSTTQYFLGSSSSDEELIGGTDGEFQNILLTYDFKTNRLICAWQPSGATITEDLNINADILIIRKAQGDAQQIRFSGETKIENVHYIYGVIEFEYDDMYHQLYTWDWRSYSHCMYYISFPFDVLVNDIIGVGTLGVDWRIQRYNGAKRAEKGWFADGEKTFWEDIHAGDTLKAYEGYSLLLNRSRFNGTAGDIWANKHAGDKVYLYFPSVSPMIGELSNQSVTVHVPAHECTKDQTFVNSRGMLVNHKVTDSHWNMIGTPMFADTTACSIETGPTVSGEKLQYIYAWNYYGNTLGIQLTLDKTWRFKTMYSYMAQYCGDIVFEGPTVNKVVAAKRNEEKKNYHLNLELTKDDMFIGRTYVELRENAVDSFMLNEDIYMFRNGVNADLFTYAGTYEAGANVLPIADQVVPVGIAVKKAGTYVFSMPDAFDGEVTLVDNYEQTRTNLMLDDYEIALPTGEITDRFFLEIKINKVPTAIDGVGGGSLKDGKAHKYIENGIMYILQNGVIYDAQGKRVK